MSSIFSLKNIIFGLTSGMSEEEKIVFFSDLGTYCQMMAQRSHDKLNANWVEVIENESVSEGSMGDGPDDSNVQQGSTDESGSSSVQE